MCTFREKYINLPGIADSSKKDLHKNGKKVMPENENLWWRAFFVCLWKINSLSLELENFIGERFMSCITGR